MQALLWAYPLPLGWNTLVGKRSPVGLSDRSSGIRVTVASGLALMVYLLVIGTGAARVRASGS